MNLYIAMIADIIESKTIQDRELIQSKLKETLAMLNQMYHKHLAGELILSAGDEIEGLFQDASSIFEVIFALEKSISPYRIRFGFGIGGIDTALNRKNILESDGKCFHLARKAIDEVQEAEKSNSKGENRYQIFSNNPYFCEDIVNAMLGLLTVLKNSWTRRQWEIISAYQENFENQYKAAQILSIRQPSVNRALKSAKYYSYQTAIQALTDILQQEVTHHA